jgi:hypothetical protein
VKDKKKKQVKNKPHVKKKTAVKKAPAKKAAKKPAPKKTSNKTARKIIDSVFKRAFKPAKKAAKPAKLKKPIKAAKPVKPIKPAKAAKPIKAAKPVKPIKPAKPVKPVKAAKVKALPIVKQAKKCKKSLCKELAFANGYCRYHYIASWKAEHIDKKVRKIKHLEKLINEIKKRFPAQYLDLIKADLLSDKVFRQVLKDMDLEEDVSDFEISDDTQRIIDSYSSLVETDSSNEEEF